MRAGQPVLGAARHAEGGATRAKYTLCTCFGVG